MLPACTWPVILGSQNVLVVGMRREKEGWLTCAGRLLSKIWLATGRLLGEGDFDLCQAED